VSTLNASGNYALLVLCRQTKEHYNDVRKNIIIAERKTGVRITENL